jgi:hypothetical protein
MLGCLYVPSPPAHAKTIKHEDKKLGYRMRLEADFDRVPPKLDNRTAHIVAAWFDAREKFARSIPPKFSVRWVATPKSAPVTPSTRDEEEPAEAAPAPPANPYERDESDPFWDLQFLNPRAFGQKIEARKLLDEQGKAFKTQKKLEGRFVELNKIKKAEGSRRYYLLIGELELDRRAETIHVGFVGYCPISEAKKLSRSFMKAIRSFAEIEDATDSRNRAGRRGRIDASKDPAAFRKHIIENKVVKGWKYIETENYIVLYDADVKEQLARSVATRIEAIREQIYEHVFPADRPVSAVSVVRVCESRKQYLGYGAPPSSAGYWSWVDQELVFYFDKGDKKGPLRILHHEAFHQYIFYSAGQLSPHSWFNEGHGDYFYGHDYGRSGKFKRNTSSARIGLAGKVKREWRKGRLAAKRGESPGGTYTPLAEWLGWTQRQYYGGNKKRLGGLENYALGWDFIYFLRTTKKTEYQGILERYFDTLKERTRAQREWIEKERERVEKEGGDPDGVTGMDAPEELGNQRLWQIEALEKFLEGIDVAQLEEDWLNFEP